MKKVTVAVIAIVALGAVSGWAQSSQDVITVKSVIPITIKGTLSDRTKVDDTTLLPGGALTGELVYATLDILGPVGPPREIAAIGSTSISGTLTNLGEGTNAVILINEAAVLLIQTSSVDLGRGKFITAFEDAGNDPDIRGAVWLVNGSSKASPKTGSQEFSGRVTGIWQDGVTEIQRLGLKSK